MAVDAAAAVGVSKNDYEYYLMHPYSLHRHHDREYMYLHRRCHMGLGLYYRYLAI